MSHMNPLRRDAPTRRVNLVHHLLPACERRFAMEAGHVRLIERGRTADPGRLCDDEADAILRAAAIVAGDLGGRHATRRHGASHRRHDNAVRQVEGVQPVGTEQDVDIRHGMSPRCERLLIRSGRFSQVLCGSQTWATPPSTIRSAPVMYELWSDARKSAALASSSARASRPSGTMLRYMFTRSSRGAD